MRIRFFESPCNHPGGSIEKTSEHDPQGIQSPPAIEPLSTDNDGELYRLYIASDRILAPSCIFIR